MKSKCSTILSLSLASVILGSMLAGEPNKEINKEVFSNAKFNVMTNTEKGKHVLGKISEAYIESGKIDRDNILAINIETNIDYDEDEYLFSLESVETIAEKILEENKENNLVKVDFECRETRLEEIPPEYKEIDTEDMYIGECEEFEGKSGCKEVIAKVKYTNGVKVDEKIIGEKTLIESKDSILYKGCKNPINDGVAFLTRPINGGLITSKFGYRWGRKHNGIDIADHEGTAVYSAFDGVVKECVYESGYGNKIIVKHNDNIETVYAHLSKFEVNEGDNVKCGELIGRVGTTGQSTGPHLHFEVRLNGDPINPEKYIKG